MTFCIPQVSSQSVTLFPGWQYAPVHMFSTLPPNGVTRFKIIFPEILLEIP